VQLLDEPVHYYSADNITTAAQAYARQLYDAWAPLHPHTGLHYHTYHGYFQIITVHTRLGSFSSHFLRDVGYDVLWANNVTFDAIVEAALTSLATDWPRQTGIQVVKHETLGSREFAIYVDAFDQVSVFPTSQITALEGDGSGGPLQNVAAMYVKMARVTFPSWVYKKTQTFKSWFVTHGGAGGAEATGLYEFPEIDWKIHPSGTDMCAVVYERIEAQFDTAYYAPYATEAGDHSTGPGTFYPDATSFDVMNATALGAASMGMGAMTVGDKYYQCAPGLLSVKIEIELSGPNPEQFSLTLTSNEIRRPTTTTYCTFLAGYVAHDIKAKDWTKEAPKFDAERGDLCVLDIECYGNLTTNKAASLLSLKNLHTGSEASNEIKTYGAASFFTAGAMPMTFAHYRLYSNIAT
jgi:hypothetical protein